MHNADGSPGGIYGRAASAYGRDDIGTLEEGKLADIIVVDRNLFDLTPEEIMKCRTVMTMCDGEIVYEEK